MLRPKLSDRAALLRQRVCRPRNGRERGIALVWLALTLLVMVAFAGFAVDLANWWLQAERLQRAADAGATAGVVYLPADITNATSTARREVAKNDFNDGIVGGAVNATTTVSQEPNPNRLRVKVRTTVNNFFLGVLGINNINMEREAVAEYVAPVPMGSPENRLGNDPEIGYNPQLWAMVGGPSSYKHWGDRYQSKVCQNTESGCSGSTNTEYDVNGYLYSLDVKSTPPGQDLYVQIYDPIFTDIGSTCPASMLPSSAQLTTLQGLPGNPYPNATARFASGTTAWCTGDIEHEGADVNTSFVVRAPDGTEWSDVDNPVINTASCSPQSFRPYTPSNGTAIYQWLHPTDGNNDAEGVRNGAAPWTFAETFRQWVTVCRIPAASVQTGKYILQVRTNATAVNPTQYNASVATGGHNRYSIRAGFGTSGLTAVNGSQLTLSARGRLPIFTNANAATATFYLARVLPYDAGRTLRVTLFDMGDVSSGSGSLRVLPPTEFGSNFSGCSFARDGGGTMTTSPSTCTMSNVSAANGYQGKSVTIDVPIPANYTCDDDSPTGCWVRIQANFTGGVNDVTTWSAAILGNPIRLVE